MMETPLVHPHSGWQEEEITLLFQAVQEASQSGRPLRDVFADVASTLKRKPNSIRNFYYSRVRELPDVQQRKAPFRTFSQEELHALLRNVLIARGNGESVRSCVTRLANGDRARMLRFQNKYRSVLKNRPELLEAVAEELRAEGKPCPAHITSYRHYGDEEGRMAATFEEASLLSQETGNDMLPLMLDRLCELLRRLSASEKRLEAQRNSMPPPTAPSKVSALHPTKDLAITLTDLRGPEADAPLPDLEADMHPKWLEARREADRLRVQVDLLKLRLEDTIAQHQAEWQPLRSLLQSFLSMPEEERPAQLKSFTHQAEEMLLSMEGQA